MAVLNVDQLFSTGIRTTVAENGWITASAVIRYNVFLDGLDPSDNEGTVKQDYRLPFEKSRHPYFIGLFCTNLNIVRRTYLHFTVDAEFTSSPYRESSQGPLAQPTQISFFTITNDEPIDEDINGKPIATAVGEPFQGVTRPISDLGIRLQKNFPVFDPATFYTYIDSVNSDTFLGFSPGILRVVNIAADEQFFVDDLGNELPYWSVTVEVHARKPYRTTAQKSWWKRIRHEGFKVRSATFTPVGALFAVVRATDDNKEPVTTPVQLDDNGFKLSDQTQARWKEFQVFSTANFSSMGF